MSVRIHFDQSDTHCFTNLDYVSGRVTLNLPADATIAAVNVKLEAESRTRLDTLKYPEKQGSDKKRTERENHKV